MFNLQLIQFFHWKFKKLKSAKFFTSSAQSRMKKFSDFSSKAPFPEHAHQLEGDEKCQWKVSCFENGKFQDVKTL